MNAAAFNTVGVLIDARGATRPFNAAIQFQGSRPILLVDGHKVDEGDGGGGIWTPDAARAIGKVPDNTVFVVAREDSTWDVEKARPACFELVTERVASARYAVLAPHIEAHTTGGLSTIYLPDRLGLCFAIRRKRWRLHELTIQIAG